MARWPCSRRGAKTGSGHSSCPNFPISSCRDLQLHRALHGERGIQIEEAELPVVKDEIDRNVLDRGPEAFLRFAQLLGVLRSRVEGRRLLGPARPFDGVGALEGEQLEQLEAVTRESVRPAEVGGEQADHLPRTAAKRRGLDRQDAGGAHRLPIGGLRVGPSTGEVIDHLRSEPSLRDQLQFTGQGVPQLDAGHVGADDGDGRIDHLLEQGGQIALPHEPGGDGVKSGHGRQLGDQGLLGDVQLVLRLLPLGHVGEHHGHRPAVGREGGDIEVLLELRDVHLGAGRVAGTGDLPQQLEGGAVRTEDLRQRVADPGCPRLADQLFVGRVDVEEDIVDRRPAGVEHHLQQRRTVAQRFEQPLVALFTRSQLPIPCFHRHDAA